MYNTLTKIVFTLTIMMIASTGHALEVCNYTNRTIHCSGGHYNQQANTYITEGWIKVQQGACEHPNGQSLYCKGNDRRGAWEDRSQRPLCVIYGKRFKHFSASDSRECSRRGGRMVGFMYNRSETYKLRP